LKRILALQAVGCVLVAFGASATPPLSIKDEEAARKLYLGKCAKCHKLYNPAKYSDAVWDRWMGKMSKKAKLTSPQEQLLSDYLVRTYRSPQSGSQPARNP
jgi:hypothetical protein